MSYPAEPKSTAVDCRSAFTWAGVRAPSLRIKATAPEVWGQAMDVPLIVV